MTTKFTIVLLAVILIAGLFLYKKYRIAPGIDFPAMDAVDLDGNSVKLDQFSGKTIFLNFWASWCAPCRKEMPSIEKAKQILSGENIVFLTITDDPLQKVRAFKQKNSYSFEYWKLQGKLKDIDIHTIPTTYIIDKYGQVAMTKVNGLDWSDPETVEAIRQISKR